MREMCDMAAWLSLVWISLNWLALARVPVSAAGSTTGQISDELARPCRHNISLECDSLQLGQYYCDDPEIDPETQSEKGCSEIKNYVEVDCYPAPGICCNGMEHTGASVGFRKKLPCRWTNGKSLEVALLLSIFLGWLGVDRFYLGYPALGLLKFCTFGCMLIWALVDILLIALQIVRPVDGSEYVVDYYGPMRLTIQPNNLTYMVPPET